MNKPLKITLLSLSAVAILFLLTILFYAFDVSSRMHVLMHRIFMMKPQDEIRTETLYPQRGSVRDVNGNYIAKNRPRYDVHMDCTVVEDSTLWAQESIELSKELAKLLPYRTAPEWWGYFQNARRIGNKYISIADDISSSKLDSLKGLPLYRLGRNKGGLIVEYRPVREYPYGELAKRTIGYSKTVGTDDINTGVGVERSFNEALTGKKGQKETKYGIRKGQRRHWNVGFIEPVDGADVFTTLDMGLQAVADSALRTAITDVSEVSGACLVLMEVESGAVRAMVNLGRDPKDGHFWENYNLSIGRSYEPGAVVSAMTLAAALEDRLFESLDETMMEGFKRSSKDVMSAVAGKYADTPQLFVDELASLTLPKEISFDIEGLREITMVRPDSPTWTDATLFSMASGFEWTMTPLHVLGFYNTLAAGGKMMKPYLVDHLEPYGGKPKDFVNYTPTVLKEDALRPDVVAEITRALTENCIDGTARVLRDAKYPVAGETGTARQVLPENMQAGNAYTDEKGWHQYTSTFAGFFPADSPKYSVVCVVFTDSTHKVVYGGGIPVEAVKGLVDGL